MKIALVGSAPSSARLAPYGSKDWLIWGCSPGLYGLAPRTDAWFELHRWEPGQPWFSPEYVQWLKNYSNPVYMSAEVPDVPNCTVLPVDQLVEKYGPYFFSSSLAYMCALAIEAIEEDRRRPDRDPATVDSIGFWGVDMAAAEEYGMQKPGCLYFALLAKARGIEVGTPPESDLFRPAPLYGVSENDHMRIKLTARRRELDARIMAAERKRLEADQELTFLKGALDDMTWLEGTWVERGRQYVEPPLVPAMQRVVFSEKVDTSIRQQQAKEAYDAAFEAGMRGDPTTVNGVLIEPGATVKRIHTKAEVGE